MKKVHCASRACSRENTARECKSSMLWKIMIVCLQSIILSFSILALLAVGRVYFPAHLTLGLVTDLVWPMECAQMSGMP